MPALPTYLIEPIWEQFSNLLPTREVDHPLGCYRSRIPDRVVFDKLVQALVFGCAYWRIADDSCSATTLRRRRDEWISAGVMDTLQELVVLIREGGRIVGQFDIDSDERGVFTEEDEALLKEIAALISPRVASLAAARAG